MPECEICGEFKEEVKEYMGIWMCWDCYLEYDPDEDFDPDNIEEDTPPEYYECGASKNNKPYPECCTLLYSRCQNDIRHSNGSIELHEIISRKNGGERTK